MAAGTSGYDAFISYSHALDGVLAPALQTGLERFAKPWYRQRALRVFRDTTNLAASPGLWSSIEEALASSAWLVLMASPEAARSKWVNREVAWWLKNKSPQRLLVVLTEGEFAWDEQGNRAVAALPPALRGAFVETPCWIDLRWLHNADQVSQSNPRLQECVADIAAALRDIPKDALVGEHIRYHRRAMRLARGAITVLIVLLTLAVLAALVAVNQRNQARAQRDTAIANQVSDQADRLRNTDASLAAQLDIAAYRLRPTPDLYTTLITLNNAPLSIPLIAHTSTVRSVVFSPDGHILASGSDDSTVRLWNVTDPAHPSLFSQALTGHTGAVVSVAFSPDGHILASGSADATVRLWNVTDPAHPAPLGQPLTGHTGRVSSVAFSPDGNTLASGDENTVRLWDVTDPTHTTFLAPLPSNPTGFINSVIFSPDGHILAAGSDNNSVLLWNVTNRAYPLSLDDPLTDHAGVVFSVVFSPDGHTLASGSDDNTVRLWNVADPARPALLGQPLILPLTADQAYHNTGDFALNASVVFSPDGQTLASADGIVWLWNVADPAHPTLLSQLQTGATNTVYSVAFSPEGHTLASSNSDGTVRLWNVADPAHPPWPAPDRLHWRGALGSVQPGREHPGQQRLRQHNTIMGMNPDQNIRRICAVTTGALTPAKWAQYFTPDLPYRPPCS